jgi:glucokinase
MTHRPITVDGDAIRERFLIPEVAVVNDLAAAARGAGCPGPARSRHDPGGESRARSAARRPGHRHGARRGVSDSRADGFDIVPGEGGHAGFAPATVAQSQLWQSIFQRHGRVSAEDVVSGIGPGEHCALSLRAARSSRPRPRMRLLERAATDEAAIVEHSTSSSSAWEVSREIMHLR